MQGVRFWAAASVVAYAANFVWERAHSRLYPDCNMHLARQLQATAGDTVMIVAVTAVTLPVGRRSSPGFWMASVAGWTAMAVAVERLALAAGRWSYTGGMPTVGRVGLSPLAQLPVTGLLALVSARWLAK